MLLLQKIKVRWGLAVVSTKTYVSYALYLPVSNCPHDRHVVSHTSLLNVGESQSVMMNIAGSLRGSGVSGGSGSK